MVKMGNNDGALSLRLAAMLVSIGAVLSCLLATPSVGQETRNALGGRDSTANAQERIPIFDPQTGKVVPMDIVRKTDDEWKQQLSPEQYRITRKKGTERAFTGAYYASKEKGLYRCV